jgi:DNA-binding CsgD family transcriptional regulator
MARRGRPKHPDILTPREWEVLALIRENLTNDQIAQRLGIGAEGVKSHVSEILGKLALSSREEAAAWDPRQRPDWTPSWDPTRRPAWATALAPLGLFWRRLTGGLAHSAGSLATATSVVLGVAVVAGITTLGVLVVRTRGSSIDASDTPPAVVAQPTAQAGPAATGKIAFLSNRDGNQEIYVVNADGSGETNLTNGPGDDSFGAWSPDGSRIAFESFREETSEVNVMKADGSGLTRIAGGP